MTASILADPMTRRLMERLSDVSIRRVAARTNGILQARSGRYRGMHPEMKLTITRTAHGIAGVRDIVVHWSCAADGSGMRLVAQADFGGDKAAITVKGERATIHADLPDAVLTGIRKAPLSALVSTGFTEDYGIHRIVDKVAYLKAPANDTDISNLFSFTPSKDNTSLIELVTMMRDAGIHAVDRPAWRMLRRCSERGAVMDRLRNALAMPEEGERSFGAQDLISLKDTSARLSFIVKRDEEGRNVLRTCYSGQRLIYRCGTMHWMGSQRSDWWGMEFGAFSHISRKKKHNSVIKDHSLMVTMAKAIENIEGGREHWL